MPIYTFRCNGCDASRDVTSDLATADQLELMCVACGGDLTRTLVMSLNVIGPALKAKKLDMQKEERAYFAKACGHNYACRCGIKQTKENPFKQEIRAVHGFTDDI